MSDFTLTSTLIMSDFTLTSTLIMSDFTLTSTSDHVIFYSDQYSDHVIFYTFSNTIRINSVCPPPSVFCRPPVTNYMLLYSTLLCKKIGRAPEGHKRFMLTKLGGGGGGDRIDAIIHGKIFY